ncbi:hypothetical protein [Pseudonocardia sediminis]|uniref:hypothetical protein n=1 Tax=Pseudonocardia sediminis TaxID=1397368 RepID=UPI0010298BEB|nr:hypothetical protein [Pseudonocardia sediminis]
MDAVEQAQAELYLLAPEDFVAERDAHVARAKEAGDKDAAKAIGALRRPSRPAWLTNLLVHDRRDEVEGLLGLADTLADAQRSLDGGALRTISAQRSKLVGALSRQAAALGREAGHRVDSTLEREVRTILESALADAELAERVRSGRLVKAEQHAGFGPAPDEGAEPKPSRPARDRPGPGSGDVGSGGGSGSGSDEETPDDAEARRRERELATARAEADRAREAAEQAQERHETARSEAEAAERRRDEARDRVTELIEALEQARTDASTANKEAHTTASAEKEAARAARTAETARDRADAAVRELQDS